MKSRKPIYRIVKLCTQTPNSFSRLRINVRYVSTYIAAFGIVRLRISPRYSLQLISLAENRPILKSVHIIMELDSVQAPLGLLICFVIRSEVIVQEIKQRVRFAE